jgi:carbonic anhydrase
MNTLDADERVQKVAEENVQLSVLQIKQRSPLLASLVNDGEIAIVAAMYDIETGRVNFFNSI